MMKIFCSYCNKPVAYERAGDDTVIIHPHQCVIEKEESLSDRRSPTYKTTAPKGLLSLMNSRGIGR